MFGPGDLHLAVGGQQAGQRADDLPLPVHLRAGQPDHLARLDVQIDGPEAVSGVGDDAYYWDARIYVRVGNRSMAIWNGEPKQAADKLRNNMDAAEYKHVVLGLIFLGCKGCKDRQRIR